MGAVIRLFCVESLRALARNKLRSGLAAVAITIGPASPSQTPRRSDTSP